MLEIDPATKAIVWKYQDTPVWNFFSPRISSAQRLPNGNTQICEGLFGRLLEVTPDGDLVWEYVNPYFGGPPDKPKEAANQLFRAYRLQCGRDPSRQSDRELTQRTRWRSWSSAI